MTSLYVINIAELMRRPGTRKPVAFSAPVDELIIGDVTLPAGTQVTVDVVLERRADGITVAGHLSAPWSAECRRCLADASGTASVQVLELFQREPTSDDIYKIDADQLDLEPMVREAIVFELPIAPLCRPDCAGLCTECGVNRNDGDCGHGDVPVDPRWAGLAGLQLAAEDDE
jgi:uncharacterized protein